MEINLQVYEFWLAIYAWKGNKYFETTEKVLVKVEYIIKGSVLMEWD